MSVSCWPSQPVGRFPSTARNLIAFDATKRQFDAIMAWSVDRLGRSLQDLVKFLSEIHALKIDLYLHQQGLWLERARSRESGLAGPR
jgi:hypothetical protein